MIAVFHRIEHAGTDTQGFIAFDELDDTIWVVLRGTSSLADWRADLSVGPRRYRGSSGDVRIHGGFSANVESVRPQVEAALLSIARRRKGSPFKPPRVVLDGHSLGGADACALVPEVAAMGFPAPWWISQGSPRVGFPDFALLVERCAGPIFRLVHENDMVPRVPLRAMGYRHAGRGILLRGDGSVGEAPDDWAPDPGQLLAYATGEAVRDHDVDRYMAAARAAEARKAV